MLLAVVWWWFSERGEGPAAPISADVVAVEQTGQPQTVDDTESQNQFAILEKNRESYSAELSRRQNDQEKRDQAGARTVEFRKALQYSRSDGWSRFISANRAAYQQLLAKAAADPSGTTPCTICNGRGSMASCFLCENSGKCPTCFGSGKLSDDELCPTCLGSGKCYLCYGTGKMICPFCDDGTIYFKAQPSLKKLPIRY